MCCCSGAAWCLAPPLVTVDMLSRTWRTWRRLCPSQCRAEVMSRFPFCQIPFSQRPWFGCLRWATLRRRGPAACCRGRGSVHCRKVPRQHHRARQEVATCLLSCEGERKPKALLWFDGERLLSSAGGAVTCDVHLVWQVSVSLTCPPAA